MFNIPSNDLSVSLLKDAIAFCEWLVRLNGGIATCVEVSEMIVNHIVANRPVSIAEDTALAQDLINRGQASANGATNYLAAAQQMARLGIPNTTYDAAWFGSHDFVPVVQAALRVGIPVLFGLYAAHSLYDDWTKMPEDANVYGHGIALVGMDSTGAIVADPNTSQAMQGDFVHYTWANLRTAGGQWPSMVIPNVTMPFPTGVPHGWSDDGTTLKAPNGQICTQGVRNEVLTTGWDPVNVPLNAKAYVPVADPTRPGDGEGSRQYFHDCLVCWIKTTNVTRIVGGGAAALALANQPASSTDLSKPKLDALANAVTSAASQLHTLETTLSQAVATATN